MYARILAIVCWQYVEPKYRSKHDNFVIHNSCESQVTEGKNSNTEVI